MPLSGLGTTQGRSCSYFSLGFSVCERNRSIQGAREEGSEGSREKFKTKGIAEELTDKGYVRAG